jgi:hypothetical protein
MKSVLRNVLVGQMPRGRNAVCALITGETDRRSSWGAFTSFADKLIRCKPHHLIGASGARLAQVARRGVSPRMTERHAAVLGLVVVASRHLGELQQGVLVRSGRSESA